MSTLPQWNKFDGGPIEQGFNQPGMEIFEKDEVLSLVREVLQNSTDNPGFGENQIFVAFELVKKPFPEPDIFLDILERCKNFCEEYGQTIEDRSIKFYEDAKAFLLKPDEINYLKISDYKTTGLEGFERERTKGWYRMVESLGATLGGTSTNGGSRGFGKSAPFNLSKFQTVFYSTISSSGYSFKGISKLNDFIDSDNKRKNSVLTFCLEDNTAVRDINSIPSQFKRERTEFGTDIFVAGYIPTDGRWERRFIQETIRNFYAAIWADRLIVKIGKTEITKDSLLSLANDNLTPKDDTRYYLECLQEKPIQKSLEGLGNCLLYIKLDDRFKKKVDYMRNKKMKIFDRQRPYIVENFAAVFICEDDFGSKILRTMEGAEHIFWNSKKVPDGEKILDTIETWIKDELNKLSKINTSDESIVPLTEDLLPMVDLGSGSNTSKKTDGTIIKEETAQEILTTPIIPVTPITSITSTETRIIGTHGLKIIKVVVPKQMPTEKPKLRTKKPREEKNKRVIKKHFPSDDFRIRLIKNDKELNKFILFVTSFLPDELIMDMEMIPVGENGEQEKMGFIKSATNSDNSEIKLLPLSSVLHKVKISSGENRYNIETKTNRKLTFNIIGNEI